MQCSDLRVALLSGNYNYTLDGANVALNRLVGYLLTQGAAVRVYSPTVDKPAFPPTGDLVSVPALPIPLRSEYRLAYGMSRKIKRDLDEFAPNIMHISAPEALGHAGAAYARRHGIPAIASVHTRFDTYLRYYRLGFLEPSITAVLRRFYSKLDAIVAPSHSMVDILRDQQMHSDIGIWGSGVDHHVFNPSARSLAWRRELGIADDEVVIGFFGRLVLEKGIAVFCDTVDELKRRGVKLRVLAVGDGPELATIQAQAGQLGIADRCHFMPAVQYDVVANYLNAMDVLVLPSRTTANWKEQFGRVLAEAMGCGVAVVGSDSGAIPEVIGDSGRIFPEGNAGALASIIDVLAGNATLRQSLAERGYRRALERYSAERLAADILGVWHTIAGSQS